MARGIDQHEETVFYPAGKFVTHLPVAMTGIGLHKAIRVEESSCRVGKIKSSLKKALFAFSLIPLKIHG
ncbi:MAG: hypothetical protein A2512_05985 [Deltaproteobacteria bacterium RIFOXYD12_FULL_56_24]|nr:MAG: hypothetical protein A2512_05985 [Deltaproteobacteria bacterium RIFOXYD12_FULL_56_24]